MIKFVTLSTSRINLVMLYDEISKVHGHSRKSPYTSSAGSSTSRTTLLPGYIRQRANSKTENGDLLKQFCDGFGNPSGKPPKVIRSDNDPVFKGARSPWRRAVSDIKAKRKSSRPKVWFSPPYAPQ